MPRLRRTFVWLFRSRTTGRFTVVQWPNVALAAYLLATVIHVVFRSSTVFAVVASVALATWAVLEIGWGVNPFRRGLGSVVLVLVVVSALRQA
jgi:hypothetical protein